MAYNIKERNNLTCFLEPGQHPIEFPIIDMEGNPEREKNEKGRLVDVTQTEWVDGPEFLERLWVLQNSMRPRPILIDFKGNGLIGTYFPRVCPRALIDVEAMRIVEMESDCKEYNKLPVSGAILDQPLAVMEAMRIVRSARNMYIADYQRQMRTQQAMKSAQNRSGGMGGAPVNVGGARALIRGAQKSAAGMVKNIPSPMKAPNL